MLLSLLLHYAQNISNIYFLRGVSVLTHQVTQSLKRLLNIAGAVWFFGTPVTKMNCLGMLLALIGFSAYSAAKNSANAARARSLSSASTTPSSATNSHSQRFSPNSAAAALAANSSPLNGSAANGKSLSPLVKPVVLLVEDSNGHPHLVHSSKSGSNGVHPSTQASAVEMSSWTARHANHIEARGPSGMGLLSVPHASGMVNSDSSESLSSQSFEPSPSVSPEPRFNGSHLSGPSGSLHQTAHAHALAYSQAKAAQVSQGLQVHVSPRLSPASLTTINSPEATPRDDNFCV
jgi:hypothetical protein